MLRCFAAGRWYLYRHANSAKNPQNTTVRTTKTHELQEAGNGQGLTLDDDANGHDVQPAFGRRIVV
jgi:hypothetical protein